MDAGTTPAEEKPNVGSERHICKISEISEIQMRFLRCLICELSDSSEASKQITETEISTSFHLLSF